jgi:hypothetical protein
MTEIKISELSSFASADWHPRFFDKIEIDLATQCWLWAACDDQIGYGLFSLGGKMLKAHRISYVLRNGEIPDGLELDHLCRVRHCVNPDHLEPVTHAENMRRGDAGKHNLVKTHCPRGHPYSGENLYIRPNGDRNCRTCNRLAFRKYKLKKSGSLNHEKRA